MDSISTFKDLSSAVKTVKLELALIEYPIVTEIERLHHCGKKIHCHEMACERGGETQRIF